LATNQPVEFLSRASAANQSTGRVSLPGLGIVVVGYQTKHPSWFLYHMVRPRPPSARAQGAQKGLQATNRALTFCSNPNVHGLGVTSSNLFLFIVYREMGDVFQLFEGNSILFARIMLSRRLKR
jgi:hypothetical protein